MKILIFEDDYNSIKGAFEVANSLTFNKSLEILVFPTSQNADFSILNEFSVIFIDIELASNSELDGFAIIAKIRDINSALLRKIVIITGNNNIVEIMKLKNIYSKFIKIIFKPTNYIEITDIISLVNNSNK